MFINICITRLYNKKVLMCLGIKNPFYRMFSISVLKFSHVKSINNRHLKIKMTLNPDAKQRERELKELMEVYNHCQRADAECLPGISYDELAKFLGISNQRAKKIWSLLANQMADKNIPSFHLSENMDLFKKYNVDVKCINNFENLSSMIKIPPMLTEARLDVMKEAKIKMTYKNLKSLVTIGQQTMEVLEFSDVLMPNLPYYLFENLNAPEHVINSLPPPEIYKHQTFSKLWVDLQQILLNWKLSSEDDHLEILPMPIQLVKLLISLQTLSNNISMLKMEFRFTTKKILSNPKIITCHWSNLKKYAADTNPELRYFISKVPEILIKPYEGALQIQAMLHYISQGKPLPEHCSYVFILSSDNVLQRIEKLIRTTSLTDLRLTPNYGWLIYRIDRCLSNLSENFENEEIKCLPSVRHLEITKGSFYSRKLSILQFLKEILNLPVTIEDLSLMNIVHYPELPCVKKNYVLLFQKGFSVEEIKDSYHILLFPHNIVVENFSKIDSCSYAMEFQKTNERRKLLQLLIYYSSIHYKYIGGSY